MFKLKIKWDNFIGSLRFYRYNIHSIPLISNLLCKIGRHDFEAMSGNSSFALLECFYCEHKKRSHYPNQYLLNKEKN